MDRTDTIDTGISVQELLDQLNKEHLRAKPDLAHLTQAQLAERLGMPERRVSDMRRTGTGPKFTRATKNTVLYPVKELLEWEARLERLENTA